MFVLKIYNIINQIINYLYSMKKGQLEVKFVDYVYYEEINKYELKNNEYFDTDKQIIFNYNLLF